MKPKEKNHKKLWLISAISLILIIMLLVSGCFSSATEIRLLPENSSINLIPKLFLIKIPNWWNIIFLLLFISISTGIIYILETRSRNKEISDFCHYEEEDTYLRNSLFLGIKVGFIIGLLGISATLINPILTRIIAGIIFTSLTTLSLIGIYDMATSLIESNRGRIKNSIGAQIGSILAISLMIGISSCFRDGMTIGMGIFLTILISSIIITMTITSIAIIMKKLRLEIVKFFLQNK